MTGHTPEQDDFEQWWASLKAARLLSPKELAWHAWKCRAARQPIQRRKPSENRGVER